MTRAAPPPEPATAPPAHERILASAGAGKTYQLTSRYLQLVAAGADPGAILATTFTRAAAGEIRDRLFTRLVEAVDDEKRRTELGGVLQRPDLSPADVLQLLTTLARRVHRMNIRTLDSFFASVVKAFAYELDLPPASEVVEEAAAESLRQDAIRLVLDERDPQPLIDLLRRLTRGAADRAITATIDRVVTDLYERGRDVAPGAWNVLPHLPGRLSHPDLVEAIARLEAVAPPSHKGLQKAHTGDCDRARRHTWADFLKNGYAKAIAGGNTTYYGREISEDLAAAYQPLIDHARAVEIGRLRERAEAMQTLLERFHRSFETVKRRRRALTFADLTHAMDRAAAEQPTPTLRYRLDASIRHLLLDEFQDTSVGQWRALAPLAEEILQATPPERSFFCVGDVKQSIYGWRGAAPDILDRLPDLVAGGEAIHEQPLHKSWRSSQAVIDAVNRVFLDITGYNALGEYPDAAATWERWFTEHTTAVDLPGRVELHMAPGGANAAERLTARLRRAAEMVAALHARRPDLEIGVLTRGNKAEARLLYELGPARLGVRATGRGGGPLTDAPSVNAVLDLLRLADHPDDTVAAFNVARSPLGPVVGADPRLYAKSAAAARARLARDVRRRLLEQGYATTIAAWTTELAPACDARQLRRLLKLVELGERFDAQPSLRADDFNAFVEATTVPERGPAPVQVMTVHQAKGQEFDIVVLPELDVGLDGGRAPAVVLERDDPTGPIRRICPFVPKDLRLLVPEIIPLFEAETTRTVLESLCVMYVAMTRAKRGLYMLVDPPGSRVSGKSMAALLRERIAGDDLEPGSMPYAHGDDAWLDEAGPINEREAAPSPLATPVRLAPAGRQVRVGATVAPPSAHEAPAAALLRMPDTDAQDRGTAMHALLEQIEWIEDWTPDEAALREALRLVLPHRDEAWRSERLAELHTILAHDAVRALLARGDRDPARLAVHREQPFARLIEDRLQRGTIDRLEVELDDAGAPARARIIDFKTDRIEAPDAEASAEGYRSQLETYREAASELLGLDGSAIELIVLFVGPGVGVRLGS